MLENCELQKTFFSAKLKKYNDFWDWREKQKCFLPDRRLIQHWWLRTTNFRSSETVLVSLANPSMPCEITSFQKQHEKQYFPSCEVCSEEKILRKCKINITLHRFRKISPICKVCSPLKEGIRGMKECDMGGFVYHTVDVSYVWKKTSTIWKWCSPARVVNEVML